MNDEIEQGQRNHNANETQSLVQALKLFRTYDFTRLMGSGINVSLTKLDGTELCREFVIHAEDMNEIKVEFVKSIVKMLTLRQSLRKQELLDIENAIKPSI